MVVGEYGETKGLVMLEDVLETLLGIEILDDGDKIENLQQLARQLWARHAERMGIMVEGALVDQFSARRRLQLLCIPCLGLPASKRGAVTRIIRRHQQRRPVISHKDDR